MARRRKARRAAPRTIKVHSTNPPRRRRRRANPYKARTRRRAPARANPRRRRYARKNPPAMRRRRRRNPGMMAKMGPWVGLALAVGVVTLADGLIRAYAKKMPALQTWGGLGLKVLGAWWFSRKQETRPIAYALGALAVADLAERAVVKAWPDAALPATAGWISLPPGLVGPTGFPTGVGYPTLSAYGNGIPPRIENNPSAIAFGMATADAAGYAENIM